MSTTEPTAEEIKALKSKYPDRVLKLLPFEEKTPDGARVENSDTLYFIITGPNRPEFQKYLEEMEQARAIKGESAKAMAIKDAIERSALAQIRFPSRIEAEELFKMRPALSLEFAKHIDDAAGASYEARAKNL